MSSESRGSLALVVEDHPAVRAFLAATLRQAFPGIEVDEAGDLRNARAWLESHRRYRIALVDIGLPDGSGLELVRHIADAHPSTLVVVTTIYDDDDHLFSAIAAGAGGYLLKEQAQGELLKHLKELDDGIPALSPSVARRMLAFFRRNPSVVPASKPFAEATLSPRETEVLAYIGRGLRIGEVAALLEVAESTVATYVKNIYRKLNISSRAEAALEAARRGLV